MGIKKTLNDYFIDPLAIKRCLIRAQVSTKVSQIGLDRFSCDGNTQDLTAAGFTEIKVSRGKWGIFPYRELSAKSPRGRRYYQMWVGLNAEEGATLLFQFFYPNYLNEPTQSQKKIWENFVRKTSLLGHNDLLVAHGAYVKNEFTGRATREIYKKLSIRVEKRQFDQKFLVLVEPLASIETTIEIQGLRDTATLTDFTFEEPLVEIDFLITERGGEVVLEKVGIVYSVVDQFSFTNKMISPNRLKEYPDYFFMSVIQDLLLL